MMRSHAPNQVTAPMRTRMRELYALGYVQRSIARAFRISQPAVSKHVRDVSPGWPEPTAPIPDPFRFAPRAVPRASR